MRDRIPPRIHVILARESSAAVVFRRGPSKHTCTLSWNRADDSFQLGQWFKGRIYHFRSDLSPDGKLFVYFAINGHWEGEAMGSWTAVSRAPFLQPISIWPKGDCWNGGGLFLSNNHVEINDCGPGPHEPPLRLSHEVRTTLKPWNIGECPQIYYRRLTRDGWHYLKHEIIPGGKRNVFEKPLEAGWRLQKHAFSGSWTSPGKGCYFDEHILINDSSKTIKPLPSEWADFDGQRLLWANRGKIYASLLNRNGAYEEAIFLHDLNDMQFDPLEAFCS